MVGPVGVTTTGISTITIRHAEGTFKVGETIEIDGEDNALTVSMFENLSINKAKSVFQGSSVGINTFNADLVLGSAKLFVGEDYTISAESGGISTIVSNKPIGIATAGTSLAFK